MHTFESYDTDLIAVLLAYAGARLLGLNQQGKRFAFTVEVDRERPAAVRSAWDARTLEANVYEFSAKRRELVKTIRERSQP